jgi:uncharacterized membrane protein
VDFGFDGVSDFTIPVYSIDNNNAYADRDISNSFTASVDSTMAYSNSGGNHVFTTTLPFGGDGSPQTITGPFTERIVAVINSGILTNPASAGTYTATGVFTSVDPDTDGADNTTGDPPMTLNISQDILITSTVTNNPPSAPQLVFPANGQTGVSTTVIFEWKPSADPDGDTVTYDLYYCTDPDPFNNCTPVQLTSLIKKSVKTYYAEIGYGIGILLFGIVLAGGVRGRRIFWMLIIMILLISMTLVSCGGSDNENDSTTNKTFTATNLVSSTRYFWTVVAKDSQGGETPGSVWSFTTQNQ